MPYANTFPRPPVRRMLPAAILAAGLLGLLGSCRQPEAPTAVSTPSPSLINAMPSDYLGRVVTTVGVVRNIYTPGVFSIRALGTDTADLTLGPASRDDEILVVADSLGAVDPDLKVGDLVRAIGVVRPFQADMPVEAAPEFERRQPGLMAEPGSETRPAPGAGGQAPSAGAVPPPRPVAPSVYWAWRNRPAVGAQLVEKLVYPAAP